MLYLQNKVHIIFLLINQKKIFGVITLRQLKTHLRK